MWGRVSKPILSYKDLALKGFHLVSVSSLALFFLPLSVSFGVPLFSWCFFSVPSLFE